MATLAELIESRNVLVAQLAESGAFTSVSIDGMTFTRDVNREIAAIDSEIARLRNTGDAFGFLRMSKLIPPGGGG